jgi:ion channel POLLUX/CASTOR
VSRTSRRARYSVDRLFSKGTPVLMGWLALTTAAAVVIVAVVAFFTGRSGSSLLRLVWEGSQRVLDPGGIVSSGSPEDPAVFKVSMFASSVIGVVALACLIGLVTTELVKVFDNLRRGRSTVVEHGHTLILGWSDHVPMIVSETAAANANHPGQAIVILADHDPVQLRDTLFDKIGDTPGTRIIFRRGNPTSFNDLETVGFSEARSIIIMPDARSYSDCLEIKALLAVINHPRRRPEPYHIVMPLEDPANASVAKMVAGDEVEVVVFRDVAARIVAQTCCQPGLSSVYTELLDFKGDEIYFQEEPALIGKTFGEALLCYEYSAPIGLCAAGTPMLWPPFDTVIQAGDEVIAISADDDTVRLSAAVPEIQADAIYTGAIRENKPQSTLVLGWASSVPTIIRQLDSYVAPGSTITVLAPDRALSSEIDKIRGEVTHEVLELTTGASTDRETLDALGIPRYDHVVVCGASTSDPQEADARAMLTLLHLRDISRRTGACFSVVTEMRDASNRELATVAEADDFVVSEHLLGLMLAQIAEHKRLKPIFDDLFDPAGAEIYLKPAADYVLPGRPVNFYTVVEAARRRAEIAIGYRKLDGQGTESPLGFGVVVNPVKSSLITFGSEDRVIVIAED